MKNEIFLDIDTITNNRVSYKYLVNGAWREIFNEKEPYYIEYSIDISEVPKSVLIIPLLANILPIAWLYDAEINVTSCDNDFYKSIKNFKKGYENMYPMLVFGGKLNVATFENNSRKITKDGAAVFFSGGVDAFNTLVMHKSQKPTLITLWGADVSLEDERGWSNVLNHLKLTAKDFETDYVVVKTSFRRFINESLLDKKVAKSGDGWWHGFQHGIGIISHSAPIMYANKKSIVYIASSFTEAEKGKVTCASDPTIDNYVKFCGAGVYHDGYEFSRQMKIHNITNFCNESCNNVSLRVCWSSKGGENCCNCEKCWRTILGIYAEGYDPRNFGFQYDDNQLNKLSIKMKYTNNQMFGRLRYKPIQDSMKKNIKKSDLPKSIKWFYGIDINRINKKNIFHKLLGKINRRIYKIY